MINNPTVRMNAEVRDSSFNRFLDSLTVSGTLKKAVDEKKITEEDAGNIRDYVTERSVTAPGKKSRNVYLSFHLIVWRRYIRKEYHQATITDVYAAIEEIKTAKSNRGKPYRQNTIRDYVKSLRMFLFWMIENGKSTIPIEKVKKIKPPQTDSNTTSPDEILTPDEIRKMIERCGSVRDRAMLITLYESGCRISELARLRWGDLKWEDEYGVGMYIRDEKTNKYRYAKLIMSRQYLGQLANESPEKPKDNEYVFVTQGNKRGMPMTYPAMRSRISEARERAEINKRIHCHLYRKSRITHMVQDNWQESIIKKIMWGNLDTHMFKIYTVLSEQDIDNETLGRHGLVKKDQKKQNPLAPIPCMNCHTINGPTLKYCGQCGYPLTEEEQKLIEQKIRVARERREFKTILDITGYLPDEEKGQ